MSGAPPLPALPLGVRLPETHWTPSSACVQVTSSAGLSGAHGPLHTTRRRRAPGPGLAGRAHGPHAWPTSPQTLTTSAACSMKIWWPNWIFLTTSPGTSVRRRCC